jgi:hypothetical protein
MANRKNPGFIVDWDAGEARLDLGTRLENEHPLFKVDVLGDITSHARRLYESAYDELYPGQRERQQRVLNMERRATTETLVGHTITAAKALRNGDVALELSDGRVLVLCAETTDVHLRTAESIDQVANYAANRCSHDWFVAEPLTEDSAVGVTTNANQLISSMMGIAAP